MTSIKTDQSATENKAEDEDEAMVASTTTTTVTPPAAAATNATDSAVEDESEGELVIDEKGGKAEAAKQPQATATVATAAAVIAPPPTTTKTPAKRKLNGDKVKLETVAPTAPFVSPVVNELATATTAAAAAEPEMTSRSGRKIKPKRYLLEEIEETVAITPKRKAAAAVASAPDTPTSPPTSGARPSKVAKVKTFFFNKKVEIDFFNFLFCYLD